MDPQKCGIAIASNDKNKCVENLINEIAQKFKNINIVTNNIIYFKKLEEEYLEEKGIAIAVTNNKRKSFLKTKIILNLDFPEEQLNKYTINDEGIIISIEEKIKIHKKRFNGKIIDDYNIEFKPDTKIFEEVNKPKYKKFDLKDIAECYIQNNPEQIKNIIICK